MRERAHKEGVEPGRAGKGKKKGKGIIIWRTVSSPNGSPSTSRKGEWTRGRKSRWQNRLPMSWLQNSDSLKTRTLSVSFVCSPVIDHIFASSIQLKVASVIEKRRIDTHSKSVYAVPRPSSVSFMFQCCCSYRWAPTSSESPPCHPCPSSSSSLLKKNKATACDIICSSVFFHALICLRESPCQAQHARFTPCTPSTCGTRLTFRRSLIKNAHLPPYCSIQAFLIPLC